MLVSERGVLHRAARWALLFVGFGGEELFKKVIFWRGLVIKVFADQV